MIKRTQYFESTGFGHFTTEKLLGKRVFLYLLSLKSNKDKIESIVKYHGGHITVFLEKNVDIIITDVSPKWKRSFSKHGYPTRSWQLIQMSSKKCGSSLIHQFAEKWKIPIVHYNKIIVDCKKAIMPCKTTICQEKHYKRTLRAPFLKVEDRSRMYQPEFIEFKSFPFLDTAVPLPHSPFDTWFRSSGNVSMAKQNRTPLQFCGLCNEVYEVFKDHINSTKHRSAAMDASNYAGVDALIKQGLSPEDFVKSRTDAWKKKNTFFMNKSIFRPVF